MGLRRRGLAKFLFMIPAVWFGAVIILSLHTTSTPALTPNEHTPVTVKAQSTSDPSLVDRLLNVLPFKHSNVDNDHPVEERGKAIEQARLMKAKVQVPAPEDSDQQKNPKKGAPGELGIAVRIDKDKLSADEREKYDQGWKNNAFNQYASDMISLRRSLADVRDPE
jgi:hypothetical protein